MDFGGLFVDPQSYTMRISQSVCLYREMNLTIYPAQHPVTTPPPLSEVWAGYPEPAIEQHSQTALALDLGYILPGMPAMEGSGERDSFAACRFD